jgi:hypothetical protein
MAVNKSRGRREAVRRRAVAARRRVVPPEPENTPTWDEVLAAGADAGTAVSEALAEERAGRWLARW